VQPPIINSSDQSTTKQTINDAAPSTVKKETTPTIVKSSLLNVNSLSSELEESDLAFDFVNQQKENEAGPDYVYKERDDDKGDKNWSSSIGFNFIYGKAPSRLSPNGDSIADYLQNRKDTETSLDAVRIGLDLRWQHKSGFYIKPGVEYEQINERFDYVFTRDTVLDQADQIVATVYDINGTPSDSIGTARVVERYTLDKEIYNRYHSIDIPILIGYASQKNKFGWFVEGGASMNLWFKARGQIVDFAGSDIRLTDNADLFKPRTGISLIGSIGLSYQLTEQFNLSLSPSIKYHLGSISSDENLIDQKYTNVGLQLGLRYHW